MASETVFSSSLMLERVGTEAIEIQIIPSL